MPRRARGSPIEELGGGGVVLFGRPAGTVLAFANPHTDAGLFVWGANTFLAVLAYPDIDSALVPRAIGSHHVAGCATDVVAP